MSRSLRARNAAATADRYACWNILAEKTANAGGMGPLKDSHHWQYEFKEEDLEKPDAEVQRGDFGEFEQDDSASEPEEYEIFRAGERPGER